MLLILNQSIKLERTIIQTCSRPSGAFREILQPCRLVKVRHRIKLQVVLRRSNNLEGKSNLTEPELTVTLPVWKTALPKLNVDANAYFSPVSLT